MMEKNTFEIYAFYFEITECWISDRWDSEKFGSSPIVKGILTDCLKVNCEGPSPTNVYSP